MYNQSPSLTHTFHYDTPTGTFGQEKRWQLGVPSTYQHPLAPSDTLTDPSSMTQLDEKLERSSLKETAANGRSDGGKEGGELSVESVVSFVSEESRGEEEGEEASSDFRLSGTESATKVTLEV